MSVVAAAIVTSAVVGGYSANKASKAQSKSAKAGMAAEERMSEKNLEFQQEMAGQQRSDFAPWREAGERSLLAIEQGIQSGAFEVGNINLEDDPGYRVRMQEGIDAIDASASARGRLLSGSQNKALTQYGQEQGSKEYANAYARELQQKQQKYNMLSNLNQGGQASAARQAQASGNLGQIGGNIMSNTGRSKNINQAAQNWLSYGMNTPATVNQPSNLGTGNNSADYGGNAFATWSKNQ
mgnify:CR=1 FL=1